MFERATTAGERINVSAGHWTDHPAKTGCTVVLFSEAVPAVVDVRGGAPGTRETALLGPGDLVQTVDAILLTGGSAFGLAAADGVMLHLRGLNRGVNTAAGPVPIVPAAVLFDLTAGSPSWPTSEAGRLACESARPLGELARGMIGAGRGATTRKIFRGITPERGGLGLGSVPLDDGSVVHAIVAVNAAGKVITEPGASDPRPSLIGLNRPDLDHRSSTTLAVVIIDAPVDRRMLTRAAVAAHDAIARKILPSHTIFDGDVVFVAGLQSGLVTPDRVLAYGVAVEIAVERAIVDAVTA